MLTWRQFKKLVTKIRGQMKVKDIKVAYRSYLTTAKEHGEKMAKVALAFYLMKEFSLEGDSREDIVNQIKQWCETIFLEDFGEINWASLRAAFPEVFGEIERKLNQIKESH